MTVAGPCLTAEASTLGLQLQSVPPQFPFTAPRIMKP